MRMTRVAKSTYSAACLMALLFLPLVAGTLAAQTVPGTNSQATALAVNSLAALTHGTAVTDAKLQAEVNYSAGSDEESGPATLEASGDLASRITLNLSGGQRLQIQNGTQAEWAGPDGQQHLQALHNSLNWAAWFFPTLAIGGLLQDPSYTTSYVGPDMYAGSPAQHLRIVRQLPGQGDPATMKLLLELSTTDLYLDASSLLPVALEYNIHPDNNALQNIPVKVEFENYQTVGGVRTPFHIRQFLQGSLLLDISVSGGTINTGLPPGDFQIQKEGR
jgi:hypothetical protein